MGEAELQEMRVILACRGGKLTHDGVVWEGGGAVWQPQGITNDSADAAFRSAVHLQAWILLHAHGEGGECEPSCRVVFPDRKWSEALGKAYGCRSK